MLFSTLSFTQELNANAKDVKSTLPGIYQMIKTSASEKWDTEYTMIIYTINKQCDAIKELKRLMNDPGYDENIMLDALIKWSEFDEDNEIISSDNVMIVYEYKKQLKAKNSF